MWNFDNKQQFGVDDATKTGDRIFVGAYNFVWLEDNTHNSICSDSRVQDLDIIGQQLVVSNNYLHAGGPPSKLVPRLPTFDLLLELPPSQLGSDVKNYGFPTWLQHETSAGRHGDKEQKERIGDCSRDLP